MRSDTARVYGFVFLEESVTGVFWTVWAANLLQEGLSFRDMALGAGALFAALAVFEIPTGYIADRYGRRMSTLLGSVGLALSFGLLGVSTGSLATWTALGLAGVSLTLISGASTAWFLELNENGSRLPVDKLMAHFQLLGRVAMIFGAFAGAWTTEVNPKLTWLLASVLSVAAACMVASLPAGHHDKHSEPKRARLSLQEISLPGKKSVFGMLLASTMLFGLEAGIRNVIYQPFVVSLSTGVMALAWFQTTLALSRICGLVFYSRVLTRWRTKEMAAPFGLAVFALAQFVAWGTGNPFTFIVTYAASIFCVAWYFPLRIRLVTESAKPEYRATAMSADSMIQGLGSALSCGFIALALSPETLRTGWLIGAVALVLASVLFFIGLSSTYRSGNVNLTDRASV